MPHSLGEGKEGNNKSQKQPKEHRGQGEDEEEKVLQDARTDLPMPSHAGFLAGLRPVQSPCCSRGFLLKDCSPWEKPTMEQLMNFPQVESVLPATVIGKQSPCLYLDP